MTSDESTQIRLAIEESLDRAERNWDKVGHVLEAKFVKSAESIVVDSVPSNIPGYPLVNSDVPKVDEFIALVVDMRASTLRLKTNLKEAKVNGFKRIYYETSALLPAVAITCGFHDGQVTEYLGDGALVLFGVDKNNRSESVRTAYRAAKNCIGEMRNQINLAIATRYQLPNISLGVGVAMSHAMVTTVGYAEKYQPKAIGTCIWDATKLSAGTNVIHISSQVKDAWPSSKGGKMRFKPLDLKNVDGFKLVGPEESP